jgi:putative membrane protein
MRLGLLFSLALAIVAVVFALQNPQPMQVNLLFVETSGSTALILILTFSAGILVGLLSTLPTQFRLRRELRALRRRQSSDASADAPTPSPDDADVSDA